MSVSEERKDLSWCEEFNFFLGKIGKDLEALDDMESFLEKGWCVKCRTSVFLNNRRTLISSFYKLLLDTKDLQLVSRLKKFPHVVSVFLKNVKFSLKVVEEHNLDLPEFVQLLTALSNDFKVKDQNAFRNDLAEWYGDRLKQYPADILGEVIMDALVKYD